VRGPNAPSLAITATLKRMRASAIDEAKFQEIANAVKRDCPVSQALASVPEDCACALRQTAAPRRSPGS
jgi:organic hydroperoxide reductase OsmC/OhrA